MQIGRRAAWSGRAPSDSRLHTFIDKGGAEMSSLSCPETMIYPGHRMGRLMWTSALAPARILRNAHNVRHRIVEVSASAARGRPALRGRSAAEFL
jgi:hypothetical protein